LLIDNENVNFKKSDVFSLAMTMVNCCGVPYKNIKHISSIEISEKFTKEIEEVITMISSEYGDIIKNLLKGMLCFDRHTRIEMKEVIETLKSLSKKQEPIKVIKEIPSNKSLPPNREKKKGRKRT